MVRVLIIFMLISFSSCQEERNYELDDLEGIWISEKNRIIEINDIYNSNLHSNYIESECCGLGKNVFLNEDILMFKRKSNLLRFNNNEQDSIVHDFKVHSLSKSELVVSPISDNSIKLFDTKEKIKFVKEAFAIDSTILFKKITFNTTGCFGSCSSYSLSIDSQRNTRLHREKVYPDGERMTDKNLTGYFTGRLHKDLYDELINQLKTCNLRSLKFNDIDCCDGPITTIVVEFGDEIKKLKSMTPPRIAKRLIEHLHKICEEAKLNKTEDVLEFKDNY